MRYNIDIFSKKGKTLLCWYLNRKWDRNLNNFIILGFHDLICIDRLLFGGLQFVPGYSQPDMGEQSTF